MDLRSSATQRETATHDNKRTRVSISRSCQMLENSQQASRSFNPASKLRSDAIFPAYSYYSLSYEILIFRKKEKGGNILLFEFREERKYSNSRKGSIEKLARHRF